MRHPDRVRSLMICASEAGGGDPADHQARADMVMRLDMPGVMDWALKRWFSQEAIDLGNHPGIEYVRDRLLRNTKEQFAAGWLALGGNNTLGDLHKISVPTTVLHPIQDNSSIESKQEMVNRITGSRLVTVPGPHMVHLELPEVYEPAVLEHLDWVDEQLKA